ncbi:MAG: calcium/sodium antiporter [Candidatus Methanomethylophilaceae archaeon]|nr:calcium/sodium antiporter [Candidatus Methanomethylophilaceae archaeon]
MFWLIGIILGIVMLYFGSDWLVDGAKKLALRLGVAPFVIGLTVLAFGSSAPEAVTSIVSTSNPDIIIGNVIGSNIANIGLCIGLAALINPMVAKFTSMRFEIITMVFSAILITLLGIIGYIGQISGVILIALLFLFILIVYFSKRGDAEGQESYVSEIDTEIDRSGKMLALWIGMCVIGLVLLFFGARFFIEGATELARIIGVSELMIGLIVVAIGTSLPELCISLMAAFRGENELAVSNIVGSNIFNAFFVLGIGASLVDVPVSDITLTFHMPVMIALSVLMFLMVWRKNEISKISGALLLAVYVGYVISMALVPSLTM